MRRSFFAGLFLLAFCMFFCCNPMKAYAEVYTWGSHTEYVEGEGDVTVICWHSGIECTADNAISEMPESFSAEDNFNIYVAPNEECKEFFKNLKGEIGAINLWIPADTSLQIGSEGEELYIATGADFGTGNVTVYADLFGCSVIKAMVTIYGDVENRIFLGSANENVADHHSGDLYVNGNVGSIMWYQTHESPQFENVYYDCFNGSCTVTGTVGLGEIYTVLYDSVLGRDACVKTGEFGPCEAGIFGITDGVLSDEVDVTDVTPCMEYYFEYRCYSSEWCRVGYNAETHAMAFSERCSFEDVDGEGQITIYGASEDIVLDFDVNHLLISMSPDCSANVKVNGNVRTLNYLMSAHSQNSTIITGNVESANIMYKYRPEYNLEVKGKVLSGSIIRVYGNTFQDMGRFSAENAPIVISGNLNPDIYIYTGANTAYQPIQEEDVTSALEDYEVGSEITVNSGEGDITIQKNAIVYVSETSAEVFWTLADSEALEETLRQLEESVVEGTDMEANATLLNGLDINISTYYENVNTGDIYNSGEYAEESITELGDEKALEFTIKIPSGMYDENLKYTIIREHVNADGSVSLEVLEAVCVGDELHFSSNKFSTFLLVAVEETEKPEQTPDEPDTPDTPDTPEEKVRAFVERMYTVALGRAAEAEGLDFYVQRLFSGDSNGACLAESFLCSPEFLNKGHSNAEYVKVLYRTFFDREPAAEEVNYWVDKLSNGQTKAFVLSGFVNSYEFDNLCAQYGISRGFMREDGKPLNPGIGRFAERMYTVVLERAGEKEGIEYWSLSIANGVCTPKDAAKNFFLSPEYVNKNTSDAQYITTLYKAFMDREPEAGGVEYWQNVLKNGATREQILEGFADSAEFKGIMASFGL